MMAGRHKLRQFGHPVIHAGEDFILAGSMLILLRQDGILPRQVLIHFGQDIQDLHRSILLGIRLPESYQFALS